METYNEMFKATKKSNFLSREKERLELYKISDTKLHLFLHLIIQFISRFPESQGRRRNALLKQKQNSLESLSTLWN